MLRHSVWALALCVLPVSAFPIAQAQYGDVPPCPEVLQPGFDSISPTQSEAILRTLAGKEFAGRGTGQPGYLKAARFVAQKLSEFGLEPLGKTGTISSVSRENLDAFYHYVPLQQRTAIVEHCSLSAPGKLMVLAEGNLGFDTYSSSTQIDGPLVFVNCPSETFQFPRGTDLRGRVVIYQTADKNAQYVSRKLDQYRPLAAFRIVDQVPVSVGQIVTPRVLGAPVKGSIVRHAADALLSRLGVPIAPLKGAQRLADVTQSNTNVVVSNPTRQTQIMVPNVIAVVPGSDPDLAHEFVVVGAHLDHLGVGSASTFYGADDNGSGSTAVLNIANALATNPMKPKRSVVLMWFAAEEHGLLGSEHYCNHPSLPHANMVCMLNIDMVGRNEESREELPEDNQDTIHLIGSKKGGTSLHAAIEEANQHIGFRFEYDEESIFKRSDQFNFFQRGVEVAFLFGGFHPDYHDTTDVVDKINFTKIVSAARLYYLTLYKAADHGRYRAAVTRQPQQVVPLR